MFRRRQDSLGQILPASCVALALLVAALLSASPQLHQLLHPDAGAASHLCVVTLVSSGHCQHSTTAPIAAPLAELPLAGLLPAARPGLLSAAPRSSILEHAPPVFA